MKALPIQMTEKDGIYKHPNYYPTDKLEDGSETLLHMLYNISVSNNGSKDCLGTIVNGGKIEYISYKQFFEKSMKLSTYLKDLHESLDHSNEYKNDNSEINNENIYPGVKDIVGIFSVNRAEWLISEFGIYAANMTNCPLYATFGWSSVRHILKETEMKICFVSKQKAVSLYDILIGKKDAGVPSDNVNTFSLKYIILFDDVEDDLIQNYNNIGIEVILWNRIFENDDSSSENENTTQKNKNPLLKKTEVSSDEETGSSDSSDRFHFLKGSDIATVCYTSGTSGTPKGVMLSHTNFISQISPFFRGNINDGVFRIKKDDVYLSYLPLAHVMERICVQIFLSKSAKLVFFRGNPKLLQEDLKIAKPTVMVGVPRVYNVFKEKIEEKVNSRSFIVRFLFKTALKYKIWKQKKEVYENYFLDRFIFKKVKDEFGGKIRAGLNGSAPVAEDVMKFLQAVFSMRIFQGYGQTEGTAISLLTLSDDHSNERVGIPFPSTLVKLIPTDEYNGTSKGEICLKGNPITSGYYKQPEMTKKLFTEDGWLRTGDIGEVDCNFKAKAFKIVGRSKEIFKTSHGEYIVPEKIENTLKGGIVEDILIVGRSCGDFIGALVVCKDKNIAEDEILEKITEKGDKAFKTGMLTKIEIPKKIYVLRNDFESYGEMLTPTMKKKRRAIEDYFDEIITDMFKNQ